MNESLNSRKIIIVILLLSVVQMGTVVISSILSDVAAAFPQAGDQGIQFLMTFPSLAVLVSSVVSTLLAARIPKKYIASAGGFLFALSGILSWLIHGSFAVLFVWAGMMGIGIGFVVPMVTSLIADCFPEDRQQLLMGWQSSASNAGGMIMTFVGGWIAGIHWNWTYLVYAIALPGAVLALFWLPKAVVGEGIEQGRDTDTHKSGNILKAIVTPEIAGAFIAAFFGTMLYNNVPANISMLLTEKGLGSSGEAGIASALLLLASAVSGIFFGKIADRIGRFVVTLGFGVMTAGMIIIAFGRSLPLIYIGCLIGGTALSLIMPRKMFDATQRAEIKSEVATMLTLAGSYLGAFATPLLTGITKALTGLEQVALRLLLGAGIALVCAVVLFVKYSVQKRKAGS